MESNGRAEAREALGSVERERVESARRYSVPRGYHEVQGLAIAIITLGISLNNAREDLLGTVILGTSVLVSLTLFGTQMTRFRRLNGSWFSSWGVGWSTRLVAVASGLFELLAIVAATLAATEGMYAVTVVISLVAGAGFVVLSRYWSRRYIAELHA